MASSLLLQLLLLAPLGWAVVSELLLAATHLKVLLCLGKPYPTKELSSKRWSYFVYDLLSPWLSLGAMFVPCLLLTALQTEPLLQHVTGIQPAAVAPACHHGLHRGFHSSGGPLLALQRAADGGPAGNYSTTAVLRPLNATPAAPAPAAPAAPLEAVLGTAAATPAGVANAQSCSVGSDLARYSDTAGSKHGWLSLAAVRNAAGAVWQASSTSLKALLLLMVGHAALHLYYIVAWETKHGRHVVEMSTVQQMLDRFKQYPWLEVVWFVAGTSYDILTHVLMLAVLVQQAQDVHRALAAA
jgi:hypothetical protein